MKSNYKELRARTKHRKALKEYRKARKQPMKKANCWSIVGPCGGR